MSELARDSKYLVQLSVEYSVVSAPRASVLWLTSSKMGLRKGEPTLLLKTKTLGGVFSDPGPESLL